jgi:hypothetical protein
MEFALVLRELLSRWRLLAVGVLIAGIAAILSVYRLDGFKLRVRTLQHSSASTQVLVDAPGSVLGNLSQAFEPLAARAVVYANFMTSPVVLQLIGQQAGVPGEQIYAAGPVNANLPRVEQEPVALKRNVQITGEPRPYRLNFSTTASVPTINIYSQAPTTNQAIALANGAAVGLRHYVESLQDANHTPPASRVTIRELGSASGAVANAGISKALAAMVFVAVLVLWCLLVLAGARFAATWRASGAIRSGSDRATRTREQAQLPDDESERAWSHGEDTNEEVTLVDVRSPSGYGPAHVPRRGVG